jgi:hypothetical protein
MQCSVRLPTQIPYRFSVRLIVCKGDAVSSNEPEDLKNELARLRAENERLKKGTSKGTSLRVSEKGGVSVYGLGRFPVTLYKEQWKKLLDMSEDIRSFIEAHESELKSKE